MVKNCSNCGMRAYNHEAFCMNCGTRFESESFNNSPDQQRYQQPNNNQQNPNQPQYQYTTPYSNYPPQKNFRFIIPIIAIIVAVLLVLVAFFVLFPGENGKDSDNSSNKGTISLNEGGPSVNLQALASGNFQVVPKEGYKATYGYYLNNDRIGETTFRTVGTEIYNGQTCNKILGETTISMTYSGISMSISIDYVCYVKKSNQMPVYMTMTMDYGNIPGYTGDTTMSSEFTWDENTGEMEMTMDMMGQESSMTCDFPQDYWNMVSFDQLTVGETVTNDFTMSYSIPGYSTQTVDAEMSFTLTGIEDLTVSGTTFKDCYVIEREQAASSSVMGTYTSADSEMTMWVTSDGIVPKAVTTASTTGSTTTVTLLLEEYYKI